MKVLTADGRGRIRFLVLAVLASALVLTGAAKVGHAGTGTNGQLTAVVTQLNAPSPGGNIGFEVKITNIGASTVNHIQFTDALTGTPPTTFPIVSTSDPTDCSGATTTLSCSFAQILAGGVIDVTVLFQTDSTAAAGSVIGTNTFSGTYSPQSNNTSNSRSDPTRQFVTQTLTASYAAAGISNSLLLGKGKLGAAGTVGQTSNITMPPGFLNNNSFVGTTLQNLIGTPDAGCTGCLKFHTDVTMPSAPNFNPHNPFWNGTNAAPYELDVRIPAAQLPNGFHTHNVWHKDDSVGATIQKLQNCTYDALGNPQPQLTPQGICVGTYTLLKPSGDLSVVLWALSNGSTWWS